MKWNINVFTYLDPNFLLKVFFKDKEYLKKIIDGFVYFYYRISNKIPIQNNNLVLDYINIYPRITHFITGTDYLSDTVSILDFNEKPFNRYIYTATDHHKYDKSPYKFIYSNYILPHVSNSSIPFTFGIQKNNKFKLLESTIYYFEIHVDTFIFRSPSFEEILKIGIMDCLSDCYNFEKDIFCGINFFYNSIIHNHDNLLEEILEMSFNKGDIIGLGLQYLPKNEYSFFVTVNGEFVGSKYNFKTNRKLKVVLQMKMFTGINVNFGNKDFLFDIEKLINKNRIDVSINSTMNKLIKHHDIRFFKPYKSKLQMFIKNNLTASSVDSETETIYNLI